jgi:hypothetical protein
MIYRGGMAKESDTDQSKAMRLFLDSTQCQFDPHLWIDESIRKWFGKRNRFAFGANHSAPEEYFSVQNLRKICMQLQKHDPPKVRDLASVTCTCLARFNALL